MGGPGKVGDLATRRFQQLADENRELKAYVADVMQRLRQNEQLFSRLFELEAQVLKSTDPEDLCFTLLRGLRTGFELDFVRFWFDRSSFMGGHKLDALSERDMVWVEKGEIEHMGISRQRAWLVQLSSDQQFDWLTARDAHIGSMALLTLGELERPFGVLGIGSIDRDRFAPEQSSDFLQHMGQVVGLTLEHAVAREHLARLSVTDTQTGSHNRRFLQPRSHQPLSQWFGNSRVACIYADIDHFRKLEEKNGEAALSLVCDTLRQHVRANDPIIRLSSDEFALLMPGCSESKAQEIAARVVGDVAYADTATGDRITISAGVAYSEPEQDLAVKEIIRRADQAMYVAKALGGNRFELAEENMAESGPDGGDGEQ